MAGTVEKRIPFIFLLALAMLICIAAFSYYALIEQQNTANLVTHTEDVLDRIEEIISTLKDAETGQRGYLLTGIEQYLAPYTAAEGSLADQVRQLRHFTADNPAQQARITALEQLIKEKIAELQSTITIRKNAGFEPARAIVVTNLGKDIMDRLRALTGEMKDDEFRLIGLRQKASLEANRTARQLLIAGNLFALTLLLLATIVINRELQRRLQAEAELQHANDILETQVLERTAELYAQREQFRATLTSIGDAVIATNLDGHVTFMNAVAEKLTGWKQQEATGAHISKVFHIVNEETRQPVEDPTLKAIRQGIIVGLANHTVLLAKDGMERPIDDSGAPIRAEDGQISGAIVVFRDVSERKFAEYERARLLTQEQKARTQAEHANRLKDEFLATISHEVRSPLNAILGWARLLRAKKLDPDVAQRAIETIERNALSQSRLIEDLLDVSRIITGKMRLDISLVDLTTVIESALDSIRPAAEAKDIRIQTTIDAEAGSIAGDLTRLQQIVWNLLSNAIKFTSKGGQVGIELRRNNSLIKIVVTDSGQGIKPEFLPYVFERFLQDDGTSTRTAGGLGLGLAIVRHLAELHGGSVAAESPGLGQGATFTVQLPINAVYEHQVEAQTDEASPNFTSLTADDAAKLEGVKVLVVDDETDARDMLSATLRHFGADVLAVSSAAEGLAALQKWQPDVLLSDIGMPHEDGYSLMKKVRAIDQNIPAVALTGYARSDDRLLALIAGFQAHLSKPVDSLELTLTLRSLLGKP